ncbi:DUF4214 domain-containing protein [Methylobacterium sp. E-005]|uniref:DUF4214 domain-containing protein n=1 Tax=Methylobacterium sp. E-005 TaxID=2836549 RepID=UPI001FB90729|nr:DUF4214 domain-containing protein [Methylobacterium sp. E-005]MCJ2088832.1 DUF4214 domain-containing protein [Methylobacterium sp. E-005]
MATDDLKSISLSSFDGGIDYISWTRQHVFPKIGADWIARRVQEYKLHTPRKLFEHLSRIWPGTIFLGKPARIINRRHTSRDYLKTIPEEMFINALYVTLLGRMPDKTGRTHYENELRRGEARDVLIDSILQSKEFKLLGKQHLVSPHEADLINFQRFIQDDSMIYRTRTETGGFFDRPNTVINGLSGSAWSSLLHVTGDDTRPFLFPGLILNGNYDSHNNFKGDKDWIVYGPKISMPAGVYDVLIDVEAPQDFCYSFDVCINDGSEILFSTFLTGNVRASFRIVVPENANGFETRFLNVHHHEAVLKFKNIGLRLSR